MLVLVDSQYETVEKMMIRFLSFGIYSVMILWRFRGVEDH